VHPSIRAIFDAGIGHGNLRRHEHSAQGQAGGAADFIEKAQRAIGAGADFQSARAAMKLGPASQACARLRELRGKVHFERAFAELKADR